jgi:hypothetical protein
MLYASVEWNIEEEEEEEEEKKKKKSPINRKSLLHYQKEYLQIYPC